jgi:hypothetical protein
VAFESGRGPDGPTTIGVLEEVLQERPDLDGAAPEQAESSGGGGVGRIGGTPAVPGDTTKSRPISDPPHKAATFAAGR